MNQLKSQQINLKQQGTKDLDSFKFNSQSLFCYNFRGASANHKFLEVSDSSESDEEGQAFYVGGSERSGQQVIGPPRHKGKSSGDLIGDMFKSARECVHQTYNFSSSRVHLCNVLNKFILGMVLKYWRKALHHQPKGNKSSKELDIVLGKAREILKVCFHIFHIILTNTCR